MHPESIKTVNEENSGGIQIEDFYSIGIFGNSHRTLPFVTVSLEQAELTEKDRIIENEVYFLEMKLHLQETLDNAEQRKMRYVRAVCLFFRSMNSAIYGKWQKSQNSRKTAFL